jgi:hypothetical protein
MDGLVKVIIWVALIIIYVIIKARKDQKNRPGQVPAPHREAFPEIPYRKEAAPIKQIFVERAEEEFVTAKKEKVTLLNKTKTYQTLETSPYLEDYETNGYVGGNLEFNYPEIKETENHYKQLFNNPENLKQAFILSEILNRKYN